MVWPRVGRWVMKLDDRVLGPSQPVDPARSLRRAFAIFVVIVAGGVVALVLNHSILGWNIITTAVILFAIDLSTARRRFREFNIRASTSGQRPVEPPKRTS